MLNGSIRLTRIAGIPVMLHWSVAIVVVLIATNLAGAGLVAMAVATVGFLASILVHELAHAMVARRYGVRTQKIDLWALGGMAHLDREAPTARSEGWIAAAGPLSSLGLGVVFLGGAFGAAALGLSDDVVATVGWLAIINGVLAVFNMLPGAPLDGGRIVRAWRWGRHGGRYRAMREAATAGRVLGWSIAGLGLGLLLNGYSTLMLIVTGAFIAVNAKAEMFSADVQEQLAGTRVRDLTWFGVAQASPDTDAETLLWQRSRLGDTEVVAVREADGSLSGLVSTSTIERLPVHQRPFVRLAQLMVPFDKVAQARPDEEVSDVLSRINPQAPVVTVWDDGRLVGVVPSARLQARLQAAAGLGRAA